MTTNHPPLPLAHGRAPSLAAPVLALFLAVAGCGSGPGSDSGLSSAASTCPDFLPAAVDQRAGHDLFDAADAGPTGEAAALGCGGTPTTLLAGAWLSA